MPLILAILTVLMVDLSEIPLPDPLRISRTNSCQPSLITKPTSMIIEHGFLSLHSSPRVVRPLMGCFADYTIASPFSLLLSPSTSFSPSSLVSPPIGPMPWQALLPLARGPRPLARLSSRHAAFLPHCCLASYSSPSSLSLACSLRGCSVGLFAPPRLHCRRRCVGRSVGRRAPSSAMAVGLAASEVAVLNHSLHPSLPSSPLSIVIGVCAVYTRRDWKERIPPGVPPSKVLALDLSKLSLALCTDVGHLLMLFQLSSPIFLR